MKVAILAAVAAVCSVQCARADPAGEPPLSPFASVLAAHARPRATPANPRVTPRPAVVVTPDWVSGPDQSKIEAVFPVQPLRRGVSGLAKSQATASQPSTTRAAEPPASVDGYITGVGESGGMVWFSLAPFRLGFEAPREAFADPGRFEAALAQAARAHRHVIVRFRPGEGSVSANASAAVFIPAEIVYDGETIAGAAPSASPDAADASIAAAKAIGLSYTRDAAKAQVAFAAALAVPNMPAGTRRLLLRSRADFDLLQAQDFFRPGPKRDRVLAAALADAREWGALDPGDPAAMIDQSQALSDLGDYPAALALTSTVLARWPQYAYWALTHADPIYRTLGDYPASLAALDQLAQLGGEQSMPFHYHRGWTLSLMGRQEEAVAEFTKGLATQPDYPWALARRGCALAAEGEPAPALSDEQKAITIMEQRAAGSPAGPAEAFDLRVLRTIARRLRAAVGARPPPKLDGLCAGFWPGSEERRSPSPLLASAGPAPEPATKAELGSPGFAGHEARSSTNAALMKALSSGLAPPPAT